MPTPEEVVREIVLQPGEQLSPDEKAQIEALGPAAIEPLMALLRDRDLWLIDAAGEGLAPIRAVELLAPFKDPRAELLMLEAFLETEPEEVLNGTLLRQLTTLSRPVADAALERLATEPEGPSRENLLCVLTRARVRDERVFQAAVAELRKDAAEGAWLLADYGDPRAIEPLLEAFDRYEGEKADDGILAHQTLVELEAAVKELGGTLRSDQQQRFEALMQSRERLAAQFREALERIPPDALPPAKEPEPVPPKLGRNAPCWCGSGKKFKKCHGGPNAT